MTSRACSEVPSWDGNHGGSVKHVLHVRHRAHVPSREVRVERLRTVKHVPHVRHRAHVPSREVRVERRRTVKHGHHARHRARVPLVHLIRPGSPAVCAAVATRHARRIDSETAVYSSLERGPVRERRGERAWDTRDHEYRKKKQPDFHF